MSKLARQAPKKGTRPIGLIWFITVRLAMTKIFGNNNGNVFFWFGSNRLAREFHTQIESKHTMLPLNCIPL